jgi:hypothetical protein
MEISEMSLSALEQAYSDGFEAAKAICENDV